MYIIIIQLLLYAIPNLVVLLDGFLPQVARPAPRHTVNLFGLRGRQLRDADLGGAAALFGGGGRPLFVAVLALLVFSLVNRKILFIDLVVLHA